MIAMAGLICAPGRIGGIALAMIAGHNLLDGFRPAAGAPALLWSFLHSPGMQTLPGGIPILLGYPLIPWLGVMTAGYALAPLFSQPAGRGGGRSSSRSASGRIAGFLVLRRLNLYGDPRPWAVQGNPTYSVMSSSIAQAAALARLPS